MRPKIREQMYTTNNRGDRDNTCTPPAILCKPCDSVQLVVEAAGYRNGGEPFHIGEMFRRWCIESREDLLDSPVWYLKDDSHLCYAMTYGIVRLE
jgi:hypothetical protein